MDPLLREASQILEKLVDVHDNVHSLERSEKESLLREKLASISPLLDKCLASTSPSCVAQAAYMKGRALDCSSFDYAPESEKWLSKATKLSPTDGQVWFALGLCLWKKGDITAAHSCMMQSVSLDSSKEVMAELSILCRQITSSDEPISESIESSIDWAKKALNLDMKFPKSWYVLGNALCAKYFKVSHSIEDLQKGLSAYKRADSQGGSANPDLKFSQASVQQYMQDYEDAIENYRAAKALDISMKAEAEQAIEKIERSVNKMSAAVREPRPYLPKEDLISSLTTSEWSQNTLGFKALSQGSNAGSIFAAKIIDPVEQVGSQSITAYHFLCIDSSGDLGIVCINEINADCAKSLARRSGAEASSVGDAYRTIAVADPATKWIRSESGSAVGGSSSADCEAGAGAGAQGGGDRTATVVLVQAWGFQRDKVRVDGQSLKDAALNVATLSSKTFDA